ncbi:MAG: hypothetical protein U5L09_16915 [Bacteroidales bacterium]|nr:hypothetical protein [Bacteroidales bacterium]
MFGSSTNLKEVNGHLEGEISGISARQIPSGLEDATGPAMPSLSVDDWDKRVETLAREAPVAGTSEALQASPRG